ncbi:MAG: hypothetical protein DMF64_21780 [Acidobacteria bacterium]|nr:MAG: hypothetical protein DMF64_21780 [Acidobacteriota bacterium]
MLIACAAKPANENGAQASAAPSATAQQHNPSASTNSSSAATPAPSSTPTPSSPPSAINTSAAVVLEITDANYEDVVTNSQLPVLLDFGAAWSAPNRLLAPKVAAIANDYANKLKVGKVNVDDNPATTKKFKINAIPTLTLIKNGVEVERIVGATSKDAIGRMIDKHLDNH